MLLCLLLIPLVGCFMIFSSTSYEDTALKIKFDKTIALITSIINLGVSLIIFLF